jgi:hypothetical protein
VDELRRMADALAALPEAERERVLRAIDGPPRREKQDQDQDPTYVPLPTARHRDVPVRVIVAGAERRETPFVPGCGDSVQQGT